MTTKSRESSYGASVRAAAEQAAEARKKADRLACGAWNQRMLGFQGPAQPSPALGDAINAGFGYLEVKCLGCNTHQTVALDIVRRQKTTPIHELERYMRCKDCARLQGRPYKRSHLVALRQRRFQPMIRLRHGDRVTVISGVNVRISFRCRHSRFWIGKSAPISRVTRALRVARMHRRRCCRKRRALARCAHFSSPGTKHIVRIGLAIARRSAGGVSARHSLPVFRPRSANDFAGLRRSAATGTSEARPENHPGRNAI